MLSVIPEELICNVDYEPLQEVVEACQQEMARVGSHVAIALHESIFGVHPAITPWSAYFTTVVSGLGVAVHASHRLIHYTSLLSRAGCA